MLVDAFRSLHGSDFEAVDVRGLMVEFQFGAVEVIRGLEARSFGYWLAP